MPKYHISPEDARRQMQMSLATSKPGGDIASFMDLFLKAHGIQNEDAMLPYRQNELDAQTQGIRSESGLRDATAAHTTALTPYDILASQSETGLRDSESASRNWTTQHSQDLAPGELEAQKYANQDAASKANFAPALYGMELAKGAADVDEKGAMADWHRGSTASKNDLNEARAMQAFAHAYPGGVESIKDPYAAASIFAPDSPMHKVLQGSADTKYQAVHDPMWEDIRAGKVSPDDYPRYDASPNLNEGEKWFMHHPQPSAGQDPSAPQSPVLQNQLQQRKVHPSTSDQLFNYFWPTKP